jgi:hypothetical protein
MKLARMNWHEIGRQRTERVNKGLLSVIKTTAVDGLLRVIHAPVIKSKASYILDLAKTERQQCVHEPALRHRNSYS